MSWVYVVRLGILVVLFGVVAWQAWEMLKETTLVSGEHKSTDTEA